MDLSIFFTYGFFRCIHAHLCTYMWKQKKYVHIFAHWCKHIVWTFLHIWGGGSILIFYYPISLCLQEKWHNCLPFQPKYMPECMHTFVHVYKHTYMCTNTLCVLTLFLLFLQTTVSKFSSYSPILETDQLSIIYFIFCLIFNLTMHHLILWQAIIAFYCSRLSPRLVYWVLPYCKTEMFKTTK